MYDVSALHHARQGWLRRSGVPRRFLGMTLEDVDAVPAAIHAWLDATLAGEVIGASGKGLLLAGPPGRGKTTLACILLQEVARRAPMKVLQHSSTDYANLAVAFTTYAGLMEKRKRMFSLPEDSDEWARLDLTWGAYCATEVREYQIRLAVIDDLGKEYRSASGFAENSFDLLLRSRFDAAWPTIVTSNIPMEGWGIYGESMVSFAHEALTEVVIVTKEDHRR